LVFCVIVVTATAYLFGGAGAGIFGFALALIGGSLGTRLSIRGGPAAAREPRDHRGARPIKRDRGMGRWLAIAACFFALSGAVQLVLHQSGLVVVVSFGLVT
jgi:hypothetical protein